MSFLHHSEVPHLFRRPHIHSGYRLPHQPHTYYYKSAFRPHNELFNFWTHLAPLFGLIYYYIIPELISEVPRVPVVMLHLGTTLLLIGSSFAHLMHSRSPHDHIFWYLIDFAGIAVFAICIGLQRFACAQELHPYIEWLYVPSLVFVAVCLQFLSSGTLFVLRPFWKGRAITRMITGFIVALWLYIPIAHRYTNPIEHDDMDSHSRAFFWLIVSGVFLGASVPERFCPGLFDVVGYGHQLFHVCVIMLAWNLLDGAHTDCPASTSVVSELFRLRSLFCFTGLFIAFAIVYAAIRELTQRASLNTYELIIEEEDDKRQ